ncbi:MAG: PmoA family protein, partial [Rhodospirillales bacterium]|nr:PmoA family protein [Rhodospirillales bacterium]
DATGEVLISEGDVPILRYHYRAVDVPEGLFEGIPEKQMPYARKYAQPRSNYIHPLFGPDGVTELTADWEKDHPHHRGIYWAWPEVQYNGELGDLHALQRVFARPTGKIEVDTGDEYASLRAESLWHWEEKTPIVKETSIVQAWRGDEQGRFIDLTFMFEAVKEAVSIARRGTNAYGGLNVRLHHLLNEKIRTHTSRADQLPRRNWGDWSGGTKGAGGEDKGCGLAIFEHPDNPYYPADWVQYPDLPWFQPAFPKKGIRHELKLGEPLVLRYRLWVHRGTPTEEELNKVFEAYVKSQGNGSSDEAAPGSEEQRRNTSDAQGDDSHE